MENTNLQYTPLNSTEVEKRGTFKLYSSREYMKPPFEKPSPTDTQSIDTALDNNFFNEVINEL